MFCPLNTRGVNVPKKCGDIDIRLTNKDYLNGLRITAESLRLEGRNKLCIRLTNKYIFDNNEIIAVWNNIISLVDLASSFGKMKMYPKLSKIWLRSKGKQITGEIPNTMIEKMTEEVNYLIKGKFVLISDINIDQFEMLRENNLFHSPDVIFEKLLIYADIKSIASSEMIKFKREMPNDIELIISIDDDCSAYSQTGGKPNVTCNGNKSKQKYISF